MKTVSHWLFLSAALAVSLSISCSNSPEVGGGGGSGDGDGDTPMGGSGNGDGDGDIVVGDGDGDGDVGDGDGDGAGGNGFVIDGCGDGNIDDSEECDDRNTADGDGCSSTCEIEDDGIFDCSVPGQPCEECGNGVHQNSEECDDGNTNDGDGCSSTCDIEGDFVCDAPGQECYSCGNGEVEGPEVCDDGNTDDDDGCAADCFTVEPFYDCSVEGEDCAFCGDGVVEGGEACDDGNNFSLDGCLFNCQAIETGFTCLDVDGSQVCQMCGNGRIEGTEACDDGNTQGGDGCSDDCSEEEAGFICSVQGSACYRCGNGILEGSIDAERSERCDDGGVCSDTTTQSCTRDSHCPGGETCVPKAGDGCNESCQLETDTTPWACPVPGQPCINCGNGEVNGEHTDLIHEECDDGNQDDDDGCSSSCLFEPGATCSGAPSECIVCGDGLIEGSEQCDDDNRYDRDGCSSTCTIEGDKPWTCPDDGNGVGGQCYICGNGIKEDAEACDDGNTNPGDGCAADCTIETDQAWICQVPAGTARSICDYCGNGLRKLGEECDDGDIDDTNGCSNSCILETGYTCPDPGGIACYQCGDGVIEGREVCDEGPGNSTAGCTNGCLDVTPYWDCSDEGQSCTKCGLGSGVVDGDEACDDGNNTSGDGCRADCRAIEPGWDCSTGTCTKCGNGIVDTDQGEQCDDANTVGSDGCSSTCTVEANWSCVQPVAGARSVCDRCGNGYVGGTETCDDGASPPNDGCNSCQTNTDDGWTCPSTGGTCRNCGDGVVQPGEVCDEGGDDGGTTTSGCTNECTSVTTDWYCDNPGEPCTECGDGIVEGDEVCDDTVNPAACAADCKSINSGWTCTSGTNCTMCGNGQLNTVAGHGVLQDEDCDDGNAANNDGCSSTCEFEPGPYNCATPGQLCEECGNGVNEANEQCDDGNLDESPEDGCDASCDLDPDWSCSIPGVECNNCGDGIYQGVEQCDDQNMTAGDGCFKCKLEPGWSCKEGGVCVSNGCGDGNVAGTEECDDGNRLSIDGCSSFCRVEDGWACPQTGGPCVRTFCGDGVVNGSEQCDNGGSCSTTAQSCAANRDCPSGETCVHNADSICDSTCLEVGICGDGVVGSGEECDDGGTCNGGSDDGHGCTQDSDCELNDCVLPSEDAGANDGDGCDSNCDWEDTTVACKGKTNGKYNCVPETGCGDGVLGHDEACDNDVGSPPAGGDGCSATCTVESLYTCDGEPTETSDCNSQLGWVMIREFDLNSVNPEALHYDPRTRSFVGYKANKAQAPLELCIDGTVIEHPASNGDAGQICAPGFGLDDAGCTTLTTNNEIARYYPFDAGGLTGATYDPATGSWYFLDSSGLRRLCDLPSWSDGYSTGDSFVSLSAHGIAIGDDGRLYAANDGTHEIDVYDRLDDVTGCDVGFDIVGGPVVSYAQPVSSGVQLGGIFALSGTGMVGTFAGVSSSSTHRFRFTELDGTPVASILMSNTDYITTASGGAVADPSKAMTGGETATDGSGFIVCFNSNSEDCKLFGTACQNDSDCERTAPGTVCRTTDELGDPITAPYCWAPATARDDYSAANTADSDVPVDVFANDTFAQSVCRGGNLGLTHDLTSTYGGTIETGTGPLECDDANFGPSDQCVLYSPPADGTCNIIDSFDYSSPLGGDTDETATVYITVSCDCGNAVVDAGEDCDPTAAPWTSATCSASCQEISICGNGTVEGSEQCDDPDPDVCSWDCRFAGCGDGTRAGTEECDDNNFVNGDGCDSSCRRERCGNGRLDAGEECDNDVSVAPAAPLGGDGCSSICTSEPLCGNGIQESGEQCDDGNDIDTDSCTSECDSAYCGDGFKRPSEACDDGNNNSGDGCTWNCLVELCGDGILNEGEECDEGMASSEVCRGPGNTDPALDCTVPMCGDEVLDLGEACDDSSNEYCRTDCTILSCGDGRTDAFNPVVPGQSEMCDDGNNAGGDGCTAACQLEEFCGDGQRTDPEECDYSDDSDPNQDVCGTQCTIQICGNGLIDPGEDCDVGQNTTSTCRGPVDAPMGSTACTIPTCGDGITDVQRNEQCDDGTTCANGNSCVVGGAACSDSSTCQRRSGDGCDRFCLIEPECGNGVTEPGEECDGGSNCSSECRFVGCGNGVVEPGEPCDYNAPQPANQVCRLNCTIVECGDGIFDPGEECDLGDQNGGAICNNDCTANTVCGDGVRDSNERCDNGAHCANGAACTIGGAACGDGSTCRARSGDGCSRNCFYEYCGNANGTNGAVGVLDPGEECDDGNNTSGDGCSSTCEIEAICGNGTHEPELGEQCDYEDDNDPNQDVCSNICTIQQYCGDGVITTSVGEQCEPGLTPNGCGNSAMCRADCTCQTVVVR